MVLEYVELCSKLSPLIQRGHEKFVIQSCVSFDQHCINDDDYCKTKGMAHLHFTSYI